MPESGKKFQILVLRELAKIAIGEITTGWMSMNRNIRFTRVWQFDGMPILRPHNILRQRLHAKVKHAANLYSGGLF